MDFSGAWTPAHLACIRDLASRAALRSNRDLDEGGVDDLAQEVARRLWQARDRYDAARGPWEALIYRIARNLAIDGLRKNRTISLDAAGDPDLLLHGTPDPSPGEHEDAVLDAAALRDHLPSAPVRTRAVLAALHPELFPPDDAARAAFLGLFGLSWEASRHLPEWRCPSAEFLASRAGKPRNTLVDQPLKRLREQLAARAPRLRRRIGRHVHASAS
jgi:RNA polymerase sigma factor (sigma-70 family)